MTQPYAIKEEAIDINHDLIYNQACRLSDNIRVLSYDVTSGSEITPCNKICNRDSIYNQACRLSDNIRVLSYDVTSGSEITPCNKICKPLVVYRFSGNVMTSITTLRT